MTAGFAKLLSALTDPSQQLSAARLSQLSDLDPSELLQLQSLWPEIQSSRRISLLTQLGQLANQNFESDFESINRFALDDEDADVRRIAIENLWECEDLALARKLLAALQTDPESAVRASSATALAAFVYLCEVSDADSETMRLIEDGLLSVISSDAATQVRLRALEALGHSSRAEVPPLIHAAYDLGDDEHKSAALLAMGRSANRDWAPAILAELHNASPHLRAQAAHAAGEIELRESLPDLVDLMSDVNSDVRHEAIWSMGQIGGSRAIEALSELLDSSEDPAEASFIDESIDHAIFIDSTSDLTKDDLDQEEVTAN